jgi:hypothetical protein
MNDWERILSKFSPINADVIEDYDRQTFLRRCALPEVSHPPGDGDGPMHIVLVY